MPDYKEMYLTLFRASEEVVNALIAAQRACEEMYISQPEPEIVVLPFGEREEGGSGSCTLLEQYQKRGKNPPLFLQEKPAGYGAGREISWAKNKNRSKRYKACSDVAHPSSIDAVAFRFAPTPKSKPSEAGSIWKGGAAA